VARPRKRRIVEALLAPGRTFAEELGIDISKGTPALLLDFYGGDLCRQQFVLHEKRDGTELEYRGELGTEISGARPLVGARVARRWEGAVRESLAAVLTEAERRASRTIG
jgi:hypothetical protein